MSFHAFRAFSPTTCLMPNIMTAEHTRHLTRVLTGQRDGITEKYQHGQREHGGCMWRKPGMLAQAEAEQRDLAVYLDTIRGQIATAISCLDRDPVQAKAILLAMLEPCTDAESDVFPAGLD